MQSYNNNDLADYQISGLTKKSAAYNDKVGYTSLGGKAAINTLESLGSLSHQANNTNHDDLISLKNNSLGSKYNSSRNRSTNNNIHNDIESRYKDIMDLGIDDPTHLHGQARANDTPPGYSQEQRSPKSSVYSGDTKKRASKKINADNGLQLYEQNAPSSFSRLNSSISQNTQYLEERTDSMIRLQKSKRLSKLKELDSNGRVVQDRLRSSIHPNSNNMDRLSEDSEVYSDNENDIYDNVIPQQNNNHKSISTAASIFIFICVSVNIGSLQIPYAFSKGGWSTVGFIVLGLLASVISGIMTFQCLQFTQGSYKRNFHHVTKFAFGSKGYTISLALTNLNTIASCVVLLNVIGSMSGSIFDTTKRNFDDRVWMTIFSVLILAQFLFIRRFSGFARMGYIGGIVAVAMLVFLATMGYTIKGKFDIGSSVEGYDNVGRLREVGGQYVPSYSTSLLGFPIAIAFSGYAFGGQPVHTIIQENTLTLKNWPVSIVLGSFVCTVLFALFGSGIYYTLGDITSIGAVPFQLPLNTFSSLTYILVLIHSLIIVPIYFYTISYDWESSLQLNKFNLYKSRALVNTTRVILRSLLWLIVLALAAFVPKSYSVFNTIAVFTAGIVYYIIPATSYLKINGWRSCSLFEKVGTIFVIIVGSIVSVFGTYGAFYYLLKGTQVHA